MAQHGPGWGDYARWLEAQMRTTEANLDSASESFESSRRAARYEHAHELEMEACAQNRDLLPLCSDLRPHERSLCVACVRVELEIDAIANPKREAV